MAYRDCPRSFMLQGSNDGLFYQDIYKRGGVGDWLTADYYTEAASLKNDFELKRGQNKGWPTNDVLHESGRVQGAAFFDFSHAHMSSGRDNGARCGSCDIPSSSSTEGCTYDGFDSTCSSAYCDKRGLCAPQTEMTCPLGYYLSNAAENNTFHINEEEYPSPLDRSMKESIMKKERVGGGVEKEDNDDVLLYSTGRTSFDGDASITSSSKCLKCAEGYYGNHLWYRSLTCHGQCHAGYYCPEGSTSGYAYKCGHDNVYCPKGSGAPFIVSNGYFSSSFDMDLFSDFASSFSSSSSNENANPMDVLIQQELSKSLNKLNEATDTSDYLHLLKTNTHNKNNNTKTTIKQERYLDSLIQSSQFECVPGTYCINGIAQRCPIGYFGSIPKLSTKECEGKCFSGTYCPQGTILPNICPLGHYCPDGLKAYPCPAGSVGNETGLASFKCSYKCPLGHYCPSASVEPIACPGGTYGSSNALSVAKCSGLCPEGYYCPEGTIHPHTHDCGDVGVFCPLGSSAPIKVTKGYYSLGGPPNNRPRQTICEAGFFCYDGLRKACRAGTFGSSEGLSVSSVNVGGVNVAIEKTTSYSTTTTSTPPLPSSSSSSSISTTNDEIIAQFWCEGFCSPGHWCGEGSISSKQNKCPAGTYGSSEGLTNNQCDGLCERGHYCPKGSISSTELPCPAGRFGNSTGLETSECSAECSARTMPNLIKEKVNVELGFESDSGIKQIVEHVTSCVASQCYAGYCCPEKSVSGKQRECGGNNYYCPAGSETPTMISSGFYSIGGDGPNTRTAQIMCEPGYYCVGGVRRKCSAGHYGKHWALTTPACDGKCAPGHYCPQASTSNTQVRCPAGRFGAPIENHTMVSTHQIPTSNDLLNSEDQKEISEEDDIKTHPGLSRKMCHGQCHAGYYCPEGSTSGYAYKCGHDNVYCPKGSGAPFIVSNGYYSVGGHNSTVRTHQLPCVPGTYCHKGVKYDCPAGTYGLTSKLTNNQCSGLCERGHYCPKGSISSTELPCPAGRFGNSTGLTSSKCSGSCLRNYRCREGSTDKFGEGVNTGDA